MAKRKTATRKSDLQALTQLGQTTAPSKKLEAFPNRSPDRYYRVTLETSEFTCVCPLTGQPDFATICVAYAPDKSIVESKSFKLYLWSYRDEGIFHEHLVNTILEDFIQAIKPHWCRVTGAFNSRGGVAITIDAEDVRTKAAKRAVDG